MPHQPLLTTSRFRYQKTPMKVTDICIGKTTTVKIRGQEMTTAYLKQAIDGPATVTANGIEGNEIAVHTDAIYAFSKQNYSYWSERLNTDSAEWKPGFFAENLLVDSLPEQSLQVGDIICVGERVLLSVSGPRIPCFKLCWRMNQPESFITEFAFSGRSGVYFNVEQTGVIHPGDKVTIVKKAENSILITEVTEITLGKKTVDEQKLAFILGLKGLSETAALLLRNRLYSTIDQQRTQTDRWSDWRQLEVAQVIEQTPEIKSFIIKAPDPLPLAPYRAGQFLTVRLPIPETNPERNNQSVVRVWSLSDYQDTPDHYRLSIKKEPDGLGSGYMHQQIKPGSRLDIQAPMGRFVLDRSGFKPILLIAGGIGVTPVLSMLKAHLQRGETRPPIYFIHCCQNRQLQPFRDEIDALSAQHNVATLHVYDRPRPKDKQGVDYDIHGYLTIEHIQQLIEGAHIVHGGKKIAMPLVEFDIYMCGPPVFQEKISEALLASGANASRIFTESFSYGSGANQTQREDAQVVFSRSGKTVTLEGGTEHDAAGTGGIRRAGTPQCLSHGHLPKLQRKGSGRPCIIRYQPDSQPG